jgi:HK97 family phage prohead protease
MYIEGYFAVFNSDYEIFSDASESVAPGAFTNTLGGDIKALCDHDTRLVLGRNKAGTLELREDSHGLWGRIAINPNDSDAVNLYERVKRGDVDQCSFGFEIVREDSEFRDDGSVHFTIREVRLFEVSVVTFPAYAETSVSARKQDVAEIKKRKLDAWKITTRARLKGEKHGTESTDAEAQA